MIKSCTIEINGRTLHIETGRVAKQANGAVVVTFGETGAGDRGSHRRSQGGY